MLYMPSLLVGHPALIISNARDDFSYSYVVTGTNVNDTNFTLTLNGSDANGIGDTGVGGNTANFTFSLYNILPLVPFNLLRAKCANGYLPTSSGRVQDCYVETSPDTTNGINGAWTSVGWADGLVDGSHDIISNGVTDWVESPIKPHVPVGAIRFRASGNVEYCGITQLELMWR